MMAFKSPKITMRPDLKSDGATLLFLDVPTGTEFGVDYNSWRVGPQFRGVKMIPPGIHFVFYSACDRGGQAAPRSGFFCDFKARETVVRKWDKYNEDLKTDEVLTDELQRYEDNKDDIIKYLGPYPFESYKKWVSLTGHLNSENMRRLQPISGKITSVTQLVSEPSNSQSRLAKLAAGQNETSQNMDDKLPSMPILPGTEIRFTDIPKVKYPPGSTPDEITKYSIDSSYVLECILSQIRAQRLNEDPWGVILGEIQFAFVSFLVGQVYDAFEQWKRLVAVLCTCEEALSAYPQLFLDFISVLYFQIREVPEDFFVDIVSRDNFLTTTLHEFFANVESGMRLDESLRARALKFKVHLTEKFKWDFSSEPKEYAPAIVDGP